MRAYIIRRLLLVIPTLFILTVLVFLSVRFIPGDVIGIMASRMLSVGGEVDREALERMLGLDVPVWVQYGRWIGDILLRGTLGESLLGGWRIEERMLGRLPVTAELGLLAILIGLVIALPVGIYSAVRQYTAADYVGRSVAIMGLATPNFWLGTMVMIFPAIWWAWSPPMELVPFAQDPLGNLGMFLIPSLILGTYLSASTMRMTRTMMLEVLRQDITCATVCRPPRPTVVVVQVGPVLLGTDHVGRDLLSRLIHGARLSLTVGLAATALTVVVAVLIGGTTGFIGGRLDLVTQRFVDAWMAFPGLLLLLTIMSIAGRGMPQIIIVLGVSGGIPASRVVRGAVLGVKENVYFRWWRTVALPYIESGDWPCVPTCHPYSTRPIPDATSRSQRDRRSCDARITGAGVGSATKSCRVAVSREPRFDGAADPSVCRRRSSARGGGNGVCHEPSRQILGGVNEHESDV